MRIIKNTSDRFSLHDLSLTLLVRLFDFIDKLNQRTENFILDKKLERIINTPNQRNMVKHRKIFPRDDFRFELKKAMRLVLEAQSWLIFSRNSQTISKSTVRTVNMATEKIEHLLNALIIKFYLR